MTLQEMRYPAYVITQFTALSPHVTLRGLGCASVQRTPHRATNDPSDVRATQTHPTTQAALRCDALMRVRK